MRHPEPVTTHRLADIAAALGAEIHGNSDLAIIGAAEPQAAGPQHLALAMNPAYAPGLALGHARAAVLWEGADWEALGLEAALFVPRPRFAMAHLTRYLDAGPHVPPGVHPSAVIDASAKIVEGAAIGPFVVIGPGVRIGARARIAAHVSISAGAVIGEDALLLDGVKVGARVILGARIIVQPGAVIGADGFSFVTAAKSGVEEVRETLGQRGAARDQSWTRIHSLGSVQIGDDVEIGANCAIDRGTIRDTTIGSGTKLDNLVHIGHNVSVGRDCLLCGQVGIAGSARIGDRVVLGGQCGVNDNIFVGDDVIAGGSTKIFTNAPAGRVLMGSPAMKMETHVEIYKALRRLPRFMQRFDPRHKPETKTDQSAPK
jgi:UDP-3-O-[3-hydroxymyristoyl] glucosamine N-acyltransferase